eukprot:6464697-Alexandrium_andersonii.AAC.1
MAQPACTAQRRARRTDGHNERSEVNEFVFCAGYPRPNMLTFGNSKEESLPAANTGGQSLAKEMGACPCQS